MKPTRKNRHGVYRPDVTQLSLRMRQDMRRKIEKAAAKREMTIVGFVQWALQSLVGNVELTAEDYDIIARRVRANEEKQKQ